MRVGESFDLKGTTVTLDEAACDGLMRVVDSGKVSQFLESLARPHVLDIAPDEGYLAIGQDRQREEGANEWINGLIADVVHAQG